MVVKWINDFFLNMLLNTVFLHFYLQFKCRLSQEQPPLHEMSIILIDKFPPNLAPKRKPTTTIIFEIYGMTGRAVEQVVSCDLGLKYKLY